MRDVFISHASEENHFAKELIKQLKENMVSVWFDEEQLLPGDNITDSIFINGLENTKYVIAIVSNNYLKKNWPKIEMDFSINKQIQERKKYIIPYLYDISYEELVEHFPFFRNIICGDVKIGIQRIVEQIKLQIGLEQVEKEKINDKDGIDLFIYQKANGEISTTIPLQHIAELVKTYKLGYHRAPNDFKMEIYKYYFNGTGFAYYIGEMNYGFWGPEQATADFGMSIGYTIEEAYKNSIARLEYLDSADFPNDITFWVSKEKINPIVFDRIGIQLSIYEANKRRSINTKKSTKIQWNLIRMAGGPCWLAIKDVDNRTFTIDGPQTEDSEYIEKAELLRKNHRRIVLQTYLSERIDRAEIIGKIQKENHLRYLELDNFFDQ
jgi:hypothetical protein